MIPDPTWIDVIHHPPEEAALPDLPLEDTLQYLGSEAAMESLDANPYWPKWDGPWWRMMLLFEMGLASRIPRRCVDKLVSKMKSDCLHFFPIRIEELPPGANPYGDIPCHCQLGTLYCLLLACGVDVDTELPWIRPWFVKYQLPDGGLNCDEAVYSRDTPHSSIVSTLPPLEAVLSADEWTPEEERFLDRGAEYLLQRRLFRSLSKGGVVINESWTRLCFPRFYQYDLLRGLRFLARWAERRGRRIPAEAVAEAIGLVRPIPGRRMFEEEPRTRRAPHWEVVYPASTFDLLDRASREAAWLRNEWRETLLRLNRVIDSGAPL